MYRHDEHQWARSSVFIAMRNVCSRGCRTVGVHLIQVILYTQCECAFLDVKQFKRSICVAGGSKLFPRLHFPHPHLGHIRAT